MDTPERREKLRLHGEPMASRVVISTPQTDTGACVGWATQSLAKNLKTRFLDELSTRVRATRSGDRLVVIIAGHGGVSTVSAWVSIGGCSGTDAHGYFSPRKCYAW